MGSCLDGGLDSIPSPWFADLNDPAVAACQRSAGPSILVGMEFVSGFAIPSHTFFLLTGNDIPNSETGTETLEQMPLGC